MLNTSQVVLIILSVAQIRGINIMLNRPSVQSGTYNYGGRNYYSGYANDGSKTGYPSTTAGRNDAYWQGDLQGYYTVTSISVTSTAFAGWATYQRKAIMGVSVHDVGCSESEVTRCGQWPDKDIPGHTIVFNCSHAGPVRFVRIWKEGLSYLTLGEVEVEGELSRLTEALYNEVALQMVITPTTTLSVHSVTSCSMMCSQTLPCVAFSYSSSEQPNCLLATDDTMTSDMTWVSYKVSMCK